MNPRQSIDRTRAFTLVELLCVMAIIAILAALMLPAVNQSKTRVKRIECINNLHHLGMAFQMFMHEHDDKFPMAIPLAAGGSQEFVQNGYAVGGEFYFSYRHFQALSNELSSPALLICPTDTRLPATNFGALQNSNVSYFVGVKAEYAKPDSILAGDRNLTANSPLNPSILHGSADNRLWWTRELHQFKGNVLFADGRVEEWNNAALASGSEAQLAGADLFMPSVVPPATDPVPGYAGNPGYSGPRSRFATPSTTPAAGFSGSNPVVSPILYGLDQPRLATEVPIRPQNPPVPTRSEPSALNRIATSPPATVTIAPVQTEPGRSTFDRAVVKDLRRIIFGTYLLVLLLFLLRLAYLGWRRWQRKREQRLDGF
jgi:prepilin-type N-terminal cleavage/methylation domain-containing protein/prepilin-type processing-associated H-X9-DG protein